MEQCYTGARPSMASLPGGEMEMLMTSSLEDQRRKAQTRNEKKLKQVFDLYGLTPDLRAVMKENLINLNKILPLLYSLDFVVLK